MTTKQNTTQSRGPRRAKSDLNLTNARRFYSELVSQGRFELLDQLVDPAFRSHEQLPGGAQPGVAAMRAFITELRTAMPDLNVTIEHEVVAGDEIVFHTTWSGTHKGALMGVPATRRKVSFSCIDIVRMRDGVAVEHRGVTDMLGLFTQLGRYPAIAAQ